MRRHGLRKRSFPTPNAERSAHKTPHDFFVSHRRHNHENTKNTKNTKPNIVFRAFVSSWPDVVATVDTACDAHPSVGDGLKTVPYSGTPGFSDPCSHAFPSAYSFSSAAPRRPGRPSLTLNPFFACRYPRCRYPSGNFDNVSRSSVSVADGSTGSRRAFS